MKYGCINFIIFRFKTLDSKVDNRIYPFRLICIKQTGLLRLTLILPFINFINTNKGISKSLRMDVSWFLKWRTINVHYTPKYLFSFVLRGLHLFVAVKPIDNNMHMFCVTWNLTCFRIELIAEWETIFRRRFARVYG